MSWLRSAVPQRCKVAMVKSRAVRTDPVSGPSVRVATRGSVTGLVGAGSGDDRPLARPAISAASVSQRAPILASSGAGYATSNGAGYPASSGAGCAASSGAGCAARASVDHE